LSSAKIAGQIDMVSASFRGTLGTRSLQVGGSLLMRSEGRNKARFKDVDLRSAKIRVQIDMTPVSAARSTPNPWMSMAFFSCDPRSSLQHQPRAKTPPAKREIAVPRVRA
jgi:hypothetical protein